MHGQTLPLQTLPFSVGGIYPLENYLDWKIDKTVDGISLLSPATASNRKTYSDLATTVASLTEKISSENKNIVMAFQDNTCLDRLIGQCKLGGCTSGKQGQEEPSQALTTSVNVDTTQDTPA